MSDPIPTTFVMGVPGYCKSTCGFGCVHVPANAQSICYIIYSAMFRNLYLHKGIFYVLTDNATSFPPVTGILSSIPDTVTGKRNPAGEDMYRVLSIEDGKRMLGKAAVTVGGTTVSTWAGQREPEMASSSKTSSKKAAHVRQQIFMNDAGSGPPRNMSSFLDHYFHREFCKQQNQWITC